MDRTIVVELKARVADFNRGMADARRSASGFLDNVNNQSAATRQAYDDLGKQSLVMGALVGAGVAMVIKAYADYDRALSEFRASTNASKEELAAIGEQAIETGKEFGFSAVEAVDGATALAKAGVSTAEVIGGGLRGALTLAAAGQMEVADAAEIASIAMIQFGKSGKDVEHIADLLAAGAGEAVGDVSDLALALKQSGLVASQFGISIEETVGTLSAFAAAGLIGSDAGTSLKQMLLMLANPSGGAAEKLKELSINAYDASGAFVGIENLAEQLQTRMGGLKDETRQAALAQIFGSDAIRSASVLYSLGAEGVADMTDRVNQNGYAAKMAADQLDNLAGDWGKFTATLTGVFIEAGGGANDMLRELVQGLTGLVDGLGDIPADALQAGLAFVAIAAGALLMVGGFGKAVTAAAELKRSLDVLNISAGGLAKGGIIGLTIAALTVGLIALDAEYKKARASGLAAAEDITDVFTDTASASDTLDFALSKLNGTRLEYETGKISSSNGQWVAASTQFIDTADAADHLGEVLDVLGDKNKQFDSQGLAWIDSGNKLEWEELAGQIEEVGDVLGALPFEDARAGFQDIVEAQNLTEKQAATLLKTMGPKLTAVLTEEAEASGLATDAHTLLSIALGETATQTDVNAAAAKELAGVSQEVTESVDDAAEAIRGFGSAVLDTRSATRDFEQAIDAINDAVTENGATLDIGTAAGRENEAALDALAQASLNRAAALLEETGSQDQAAAAIAAGREQLILALAQFGITGAAADAYADQLGLIPSNVSTAATLTGTAEAEAALAELARDRTAFIRVTATGEAIFEGGNRAFLPQMHGGVVDYFAAGGFSRERHVAQIAPAGAMRVWAEPETGGEAYIPLSPAKRARSLDIWAETGHRLGVQGFANGGTAGTPQYGPSGWAASRGSGDVASAAGTTWAPVFQIAAQGRSVAEQVFDAARRLQARSKSRR